MFSTRRGWAGIARMMFLPRSYRNFISTICAAGRSSRSPASFATIKWICAGSPPFSARSTNFFLRHQTQQTKSRVSTSLGYHDSSCAGGRTIARTPRARRHWKWGCRRNSTRRRAAILRGWPIAAANTSAPPRCGWKSLPMRATAFTRVSNWPFTTNVAPKTRPKRLNLPNWRLPRCGTSAPIRATRSLRRGLRGWRISSCSGSHGWRRNHDRLLRQVPGMLRRLGSQRPVQGFGESVEDVASGTFHGHALVSQTIQEHAAIGSIKGKKVGAAEQIRALRMLLFEGFRILSEEARRAHFAVQMKARHHDELLRLFVLEDGVTVAIPSGRQIRCPVAIEELLQDFLPAEFTHDVFGWKEVLKQFLDSDRAKNLAAAWDGDRYAVFEHKQTKKLIMMARLHLDSEMRAARFFGQYSEALEKKHSERSNLLRRPNFFSFDTPDGGVFLDCLGDECVTMEGTTRNIFDAFTKALNWPLAPQPPQRPGDLSKKTVVISSPAVRPAAGTYSPAAQTAP